MEILSIGPGVALVLREDDASSPTLQKSSFTVLRLFEFGPTGTVIPTPANDSDAVKARVDWGPGKGIQLWAKGQALARVPLVPGYDFVIGDAVLTRRKIDAAVGVGSRRGVDIPRRRLAATPRLRYSVETIPRRGEIFRGDGSHGDAAGRQGIVQRYAGAEEEKELLVVNFSGAGERDAPVDGLDHAPLIKGYLFAKGDKVAAAVPYDKIVIGDVATVVGPGAGGPDGINNRLLIDFNGAHGPDEWLLTTNYTTTQVYAPSVARDETHSRRLSQRRSADIARVPTRHLERTSSRTPRRYHVADLPGGFAKADKVSAEKAHAGVPAGYPGIVVGAARMDREGCVRVDYGGARVVDSPVDALKKLPLCPGDEKCLVRGGRPRPTQPDGVLRFAPRGRVHPTGCSSAPIRARNRRDRGRDVDPSLGISTWHSAASPRPAPEGATATRGRTNRRRRDV